VANANRQQVGISQNPLEVRRGSHETKEIVSIKTHTGKKIIAARTQLKDEE
jgi:hypothetical protein